MPLQAKNDIEVARKSLKKGWIFGPNPNKAKKYINEAKSEVTSSISGLIQAYKSLLRISSNEAVYRANDKRDKLGNAELYLTVQILDNLIKNFGSENSDGIDLKLEEVDNLLDSQIKLIASEGFSMSFTKREVA